MTFPNRWPAVRSEECWVAWFVQIDGPGLRGSEILYWTERTYHRRRLSKLTRSSTRLLTK